MAADKGDLRAWWKWGNGHPPIDPESVPDSDTPCPKCGSLKVVPVFIRTLWGPATPEERELANKKLAILVQTYVTAHYGSGSRNEDASECLNCGHRWSDRPPDEEPVRVNPDDLWPTQK